MAERGQVRVAGYGARTAVGATAPASAAAVRSALALFAEHPYMIDKAGAPMVVAGDAFLSEEVVGAERFVQLGLPAAREALRPLAERCGTEIPVPLLLGLPAERPGLPPGLAAQIAEPLRQGVRKFARPEGVEPVSTGHAAGLMALAEAWRRIASGAEECCLVGGIESFLEPETLEWLDERDCLHSEDNSFGFIPGEAAGFSLLCSQEFAERHRLPTAGQVVMTATTREKNLNHTDTVCLGEGLTLAFREVLGALPSPATRIDAMICDLNGEPYRADELGYAIARTSDRFVDATNFSNPADCWGDVGAASGPLFIVLAMLAQAKGYAPGPHTLIWTSSDSGERSAALLHAGHALEAR